MNTKSFSKKNYFDDFFNIALTIIICFVGRVYCSEAPSTISVSTPLIFDNIKPEQYQRYKKFQNGQAFLTCALRPLDATAELDRLQQIIDGGLLAARQDLGRPVYEGSYRTINDPQLQAGWHATIHTPDLTRVKIFEDKLKQPAHSSLISALEQIAAISTMNFDQRDYFQNHAAKLLAHYMYATVGARHFPLEEQKKSALAEVATLQAKLIGAQTEITRLNNQNEQALQALNQKAEIMKEEMNRRYQQADNGIERMEALADSLVRDLNESRTEVLARRHQEQVIKKELQDLRSEQIKTLRDSNESIKEVLVRRHQEQLFKKELQVTIDANKSAMRNLQEAHRREQSKAAQEMLLINKELEELAKRRALSPARRQELAEKNAKIEELERIRAEENERAAQVSPLRRQLEETTQTVRVKSSKIEELEKEKERLEQMLKSRPTYAFVAKGKKNSK